MILREGETTLVKQPDIILDESLGFRRVLCGDSVIAQEGDTEMAWAARLALAVRASYPVGRGITVAHLGGGFGVVARLLGPDFNHIFYEIEPGFLTFLEPVGAVQLGDWHKTYKKGADIVIYDCFGAPLTEDDRNILSPALIIE